MLPIFSQHTTFGRVKRTAPYAARKKSKKKKSGFNEKSKISTIEQTVTRVLSIHGSGQY